MPPLPWVRTVSPTPLSPMPRVDTVSPVRRVKMRERIVYRCGYIHGGYTLLKTEGPYSFGQFPRDETSGSNSSR